MSEPYTVAMISRSISATPTEDLRALDPLKFQTWPVRKIVPVKVIRELIDHELAGRGVGV